MFGQSIAAIDDLIAAAASSVHVTRETSRPVFDAIESFVIERKLIVSNIPLLLGEAVPSAKSRYTIYGDNMHRHANDLANAIARRDIYTTLYTNSHHEDYFITVRGVPLVQMYGIRAKLLECITPSSGSAAAPGKFLLYPPEFELIGVYHKLFSPSHFSEWAQMGEWEKKLRAMLPGAHSAIGGRRRGRSRIRNTAAPAPQQKGHGVGDINAKIYKWLSSRDDYIVIGPHAIDMLMAPGRTAMTGKIRIISSNRDKLATDLTNMIAAATGASVMIKTHGANYPSESRLNRAVITATIGKWPMPIADVYNNSEFEIVPYTLAGGMAIGYDCVIKYFMMIDLWFMRIMRCLGFIDSALLTRFTADTWRHLAAADAIPAGKFTRELYLGQIRNAITEKKIAAIGSDTFPYSPEQWRFQRGKYRS